MEPLPHAPTSLAPGSQTVYYFPWLKVSVALRYVHLPLSLTKRRRRSDSTSPGSWPSRAAFARPAGSTEYAPLDDLAPLGEDVDLAFPLLHVDVKREAGRFIPPILLNESH
jgi:hypothetical protein